MSKFSDLFSRSSSDYSYSQGAVYNPDYVYNPWRKWIISGTVIVAIALIALIVVANNTTKMSNGTKPVSSLLAGSAGIADEITSPSNRNATLYKVIKVVDGDTIDVEINGTTERLRLIGMDTPETVDPRKTVQCFGAEASNKAKGMLTGARVSLEVDSSQDNRDKYSRLLRYVFLEDGTNFNQYMITEGYAHEYTYTTPYKYQSEFKVAEANARNSNKGLWSPSTCGGNTESAPARSTSPPRAAPSYVTPTSGNCNPNYSPCVPSVSYDLDCGDISSSVQVIGTDVHRFDRDGDGYGCESN